MPTLAQEVSSYQAGLEKRLLAVTLLLVCVCVYTQVLQEKPENIFVESVFLFFLYVGSRN